MKEQFLEEFVESKIEAETLEEVRLPRKFKVILLNDDYTPMDFVVEVLKRFFRLNEQTATLIMLEVHRYGKGVGGIYTRDIAETKVAQVNGFARSKEHPLLCVMEPE